MPPPLAHPLVKMVHMIPCVPSLSCSLGPLPLCFCGLEDLPSFPLPSGARSPCARLPAGDNFPEEDAGGAAPGPAGRLRRGQGHGEAGAVHRGSAGEAGQAPRLIRRGDGSVASPEKINKCFFAFGGFMGMYGGLWRTGSFVVYGGFMWIHGFP